MIIIFFSISIHLYQNNSLISTRDFLFLFFFRCTLYKYMILLFSWHFFFTSYLLFSHYIKYNTYYIRLYYKIMNYVKKYIKNIFYFFILFLFHMIFIVLFTWHHVIKHISSYFRRAISWHNMLKSTFT